MNLKEYCELGAESRNTLNPDRLLMPIAETHARRLREAADRVGKLSVGIATDLREAANWLAGGE